MHTYVIESRFTDHYPIALFMKIKNAKNKLVKISFRDYSQNNVEKLLYDFPNLIENFVINEHEPNVNENVERTCNFLDQTLDTYFPIRTKTIGEKRLTSPWLTDDILFCIKKKFKLFKLYKDNRITFDHFQTFRNILNSTINLSKELYYQQAFNAAFNNIQRAWSLIKNLLSSKKSNTNVEILNDNNAIVVDPKVVSEMFGKNFQEATQNLLSNTQNPLSSVIDFNNIPQNENSAFFAPTTAAEIHTLIKSLPNKKPSKSDFPVKILKLISVHISPLISNLINSCIINGIYPDVLKIARVVPVFKKGSKKMMQNYRPISVLKNLNKIFEKALYERISNFAEQNNLIPACQYGFTKNKSTRDAILEFLLHITPVFTNKTYGAALFADFSKAFDTIFHERLAFKLDLMGFRGITLQLIKSYLSNRKQYVDINGHYSELFSITHGVPQGSNLGPLLFNLYISDLPHFLNNSKPIQFADDTTFLLKTNSLDELINNLQREADIFSQWAFRNGLIINTTKTKVMLFSTHQTNLQWNVMMNNQPLEKISCYKFLGITIDDHLNFIPHLKNLRIKLSQLAGISYAVGKFFNLASAKSYYYSMVHSVILYNIIFWGGSATTYINFIQICQNKIVRNLFANKFECHTTDELFSKLNILKIKDIYHLELGQIIYKTISNDSNYEILSAELIRLGWTHHYNTRKLNNYRLPNTRIQADHRGFLFQAVLHWNKLPLDIKNSASPSGFKLNYKKLLLSHYA